MPKGRAAKQKLRDMAGQIHEMRAQLEQQRQERQVPATAALRDQSRAPIQRRNMWDWVCLCGYYCYEGRSHCPKCSEPRINGSMCFGTRRRQKVEVEPSRRVLVPGPVRATPQQTPQLQEQHSRQQAQPVRQQQQEPPQSTHRSYLEAASVGGPWQPEPKSHLAQSSPTAQLPHTSSTVSSTVAATNRVHESATQMAAALPAGPLVCGASNATAVNSDALAKVPHHDIHSLDEEAGMYAEQWAEDDPEETVEELGQLVTEPNRVFARMAGVKKAIQRRAKRLEKAHAELETQRAVVEAETATLQERATAVATVESDLQRFKELHAELSKRHAELTEAAALQKRAAEKQEQQQSEAQRMRQVLWQAASSLRGLGADPRIEAAISALGSLFQEVDMGSAAADAAQHPSQDATPLHVPVVVPPMPVVVASTPGSACSTPPSLQSTMVAPPANGESLCPSRGAATDAGAPSTTSAAGAKDVEMEEAALRGKKRSSNEASLPESKGDAHNTGASCDPIVVDESAAATPATVPADSSSPIEVGAAAAPHGGESGDVEHEDDEAAKSESRASFARLVKITCSRRSYPY